MDGRHTHSSRCDVYSTARHLSHLLLLCRSGRVVEKTADQKLEDFFLASSERFDSSVTVHTVDNGLYALSCRHTESSTTRPLGCVDSSTRTTSMAPKGLPHDDIQLCPLAANWH